MTRGSYHLISLLVILVLALVLLRPIDSFDVWWHLNSGLWMLENSALMDHDVWSFTMNEHEWTNMAWMFQLLLGAAYIAGGVWGLLVIKYSMIFGFLWVLFQCGRGERNILQYILVFLLIMPVIYGHMHLRPHMVELLLLSLLIFLSQKTWNIRIATICFFILIIWANNHASVIVGSVALALQAVVGKWEVNNKIKTRVITAFVFMLTPMATPYGAGILELLVAHGGSDLINYYVDEWRPRDEYLMSLWLMVVVVVLFSLKRLIVLKPAEWFLLVFFFLYSVNSQRFELELAIVLWRPVTEVLALGFNKLSQDSKKLPILVSLSIMLLHGVLYSNQIKSISSYMQGAYPFDRYRYPYVTIEYLDDISEKLGRKLNVLNEYNFGGYISLFTEGRSRIYIDGRMSTIFPESLIVPKYETNPKHLSNVAHKHDVDAILLKLGNSGIISPNDSTWQLVAYDPSSILFVRRSLIQDMPLPSLTYDPGTYKSSFGDKQLQVNIESTDELIQYKRDNPTSLNHMALFLSNNVESAESRSHVFDYLGEAALLSPNDVFSRATYSFLAAKWIELPDVSTADFLKYLPPSEKLNDGVMTSFNLVFARQFLKMGLADHAIDYLYPANSDRRRSLDESVETWRLRFLAHVELEEYVKARNCLDIAYEIVDDKNVMQRSSLDSIGKLLDSIEIE